MKLDLFDFDLPSAAIAVRPVSPRHDAKMLLVDPGTPFTDRRFLDLPDLLQKGDLLIANDTKVIPARLFGKRGDANVEVTLHMQKGPVTWAAFARPAKKCRLGDHLVFGDLTAEVTGIGDRGERLLVFDVKPEEMMPALVRLGSMPLPPYIERQRAADDRDTADYQTLFAAHDGAVAAPTAGLHFTPLVLERLAQKGIGLEKVTLHVGAGTFLPVTAEDTDDHRMHAEWGEIRRDVADKINACRAAGGRVISVGTTSLRLLESAAQERGTIQPFLGETDIFITPGYRFKAVDALITNFHLPKSTLFMLVSAFSGIETMQEAYAHAIDTGYRFYSYGDSSLLFPRAGATTP